MISRQRESKSSRQSTQRKEAGRPSWGSGEQEWDLAWLGEIFLGVLVRVRNPDFIPNAVGREFHDLFCIFKSSSKG